MLNACHYEGLNIAHSLQMTNQICVYLPWVLNPHHPTKIKRAYQGRFISTPANQGLGQKSKSLQRSKCPNGKSLAKVPDQKIESKQHYCNDNHILQFAFPVYWILIATPTDLHFPRLSSFYIFVANNKCYKRKHSPTKEFWSIDLRIMMWRGLYN